jgi:glycosyltransferase involved in cell wall biosynthesis
MKVGGDRTFELFPCFVEVCGLDLPLHPSIEVQMEAPLLTIAIPTRERAETLVSTLRTLTSQDTDNCEFLVSDNASNDQTQQVVSAISDPRVRYVRLPTRRSMSYNYEFALSHARGKYISYLGDDDGFIPGSLEYLTRICRRHDPDAVSWSEGGYRWPGVEADNDGLPQSLIFTNEIFRIDTAAVRPLWQLGILRWGFCPIIYGGLVRVDTLNRLRGSNDQFFQSELPDVYSAAILMDSIQRYFYVNLSLSVFGFSKKSNAASYLSQRLSGTDALAQFQAELERPPHPKFSAFTLRTDHAAIYEGLLRANDLKGRKKSVLFDAFWHLRIARSLSRLTQEPYRSQALSEFKRATRNPYLKFLVGIYNHKKRALHSIYCAKLQDKYPTIFDICDVAGRFAASRGLLQKIEPTAEVRTIFDAIAFRRVVLYQRKTELLDDRLEN